VNEQEHDFAIPWPVVRNHTCARIRNVRERREKGVRTFEEEVNLKATRSIAAVLAAAALAVAAAASGQGFPSKPIHLIAPAPPGGGVDILSRTIGQKVGEILGQPVIVDNKGGGNGNIGFDAAAKAAPDGYTIVMSYSAVATNVWLHKDLPYDPERDFAPVVFVGYIPLVLITNPNSGIVSVQDLVAKAKAKPGAIQYAHGGTGAGAHLSGELFRHLTGAQIEPVGYKGNAPALADVIAGHVPIMWDTINTSLPNVKGGKLKALATTGRQRSALAPEYPTMIEAGVPDFEVSAWYLILAPKKTPGDVVQKLNAAFNQAIKDPDIAGKLSQQGVDLVGGTTTQADDFLKSEISRWGKIIKAAGIRAE
jgi:tripartite-type tricarboxylate transporter receptor subunit TctC